jgi:hypothetical protein
MSASTVETGTGVEPEEQEAPVAGGSPRPRAVTPSHGMPVPHAVPAPLRSTNPSLAPASGGNAAAVDRVREFGDRAVDQVVYGLRRLGSATLAGIAALVAAATVFISYNMPQSAAVSALQSELARAPKLASVTIPNGASLGALPPRSEAPDVVAKIYEEAGAAGVELPRGQYEYVPARDGVAARYRLTFPVHASYPQIRSFLDRTLIALPAVAVEGLRIERKAVGDGSVDAEVKFAAYVRGDP